MYFDYSFESLRLLHKNMRNLFVGEMACPGFQVPSSFLVPKQKKVFFEDIASFQEVEFFSPFKVRVFFLKSFFLEQVWAIFSLLESLDLIKVLVEILELGGSYMLKISRNHLSLGCP